MDGRLPPSARRRNGNLDAVDRQRASSTHCAKASAETFDCLAMGVDCCATSSSDALFVPSVVLGEVISGGKDFAEIYWAVVVASVPVAGRLVAQCRACVQIGIGPNSSSTR
jgi:hypothetical protein